MRLFICINFDQETIKNIKNVQERLKKMGRGSFPPAKNFHLTLFFLGDVDDEKLGLVKNAMDSINMEKIHLFFEGTGVFRSSSGYIYWIGIKKNWNLQRIHRELADQLICNGFNYENHSFKPHITLARRFRYGDHITEEKKLTLMEEKFQYTASTISLMESKFYKGKVSYREIYRIDCKGQEKIASDRYSCNL